MTEAIRVEGLTRTFGLTTVLAGVDLSLAAGEWLAVVGPSGGGKTTLLRLIAGLDTPTAGTVTLAGRPASGPGRVVVPPERRGVAMVFQGLAMFPHLRALDQVRFATGDRRRAGELLGRVGLAGRESARLDQLSGGERQRVALARAVAQRPAVLLMDEPFASLDDDRRGEMRTLVRDLLDGTAAAVVLVTHSREDALDLAGRVLVLDRGRPVAAGPLADVMADPPHAAAVRSLGLGQLLDGVADGDRAVTAFGPVVLDRPASGPVRLLVRPGQAITHVDGAPADVVAVELRPSDTGGVRRVAVVRAAGQTLRVEAGGTPVAVGQRVAVRVDGPCPPIPG